MKYFLDTEFLEGKQKLKFFGFETPFEEDKPTIDLISVGIVCEDGREYYAISKDFNLKEAWNRFDWKNINAVNPLKARRTGVTVPLSYKEKVYWIRENVLKPIWLELSIKSLNDKSYCEKHYGSVGFNYKDLKTLISFYGKTNNEIAEDIEWFCLAPNTNTIIKDSDELLPEFYTYYGAYDWVVFCWIFGKMMELPEDFPMFSRDLKVMLDDKAMKLPNSILYNTMTMENITIYTLKNKVNYLKNHFNYPKQTDEHNAIADARWNKKLYEFLESL